MNSFLSLFLGNIMEPAALREREAVAGRSMVDSSLLPRSSSNGHECVAGAGRIMTETDFKRAITLERKRAERAGNPALLLLLELGDGDRKNGNSNLLAGNVIAALFSVARETDLMGWYSDGRVLGAVFTELPTAPKLQKSVAAIAVKMEAALQSELGDRNAQVGVSCQLFSGPGRSQKKDSSSTSLPTQPQNDVRG